MRKFIFILTFFSLFNSLKAQSTFEVENTRIVDNHPQYFNNRPIYINNSNAFILTGSKPLIRMAQLNDLYGTFVVGVRRNGKVKWVTDFSQIKASYDYGRMMWELSDKEFPELKLALEVLPVNGAKGMSIKLNALQTGVADTLVWSFNGAQFRERAHLSWMLDALGHPYILNWGFTPKESDENSFFEITEQGYFLTEKTKNFNVKVSCSAKSTFYRGSASSVTTAVNASAAKDSCLFASTKIQSGQSLFWTVEGFNSKRDKEIKPLSVEPEKAYQAAVQRLENLHNRLKISTPDKYLNALAKASVIAIDGTWYAPMFVHGAMQWNSPYVGWRTVFGGSMYGWHERVLENAKYLINSQVTSSNKTKPETDTVKLMTKESENSRFYGVGYIRAHQTFYNMQTQYFDQLIEGWRRSGDPEIEKILRQGLALHLVWQQECFDPDGDGVYESYINTWPTDSQWYNGGGTAEETAYAYRGHLAARDLARRAGDAKAEEYHNAMLEKIKRGFLKSLWVKERGHSGAYREQGGHERLHTNPWLYSIFLPIDAQLTNFFQNIESVYYTEWSLQNDRRPLGGRSVWASNWVPGIWSVRVLWPGDNYHLALSYFQSGLPNDAYDIFRGAFMQSGFNEKVPGNLGDPSGGIDFGDCIHTFSRTLVSGLFGFNPDFPNNNVKLQPQFPTDWDSASIEIPDAKLHYLRNESQTTYNFEISKAANVDLEIPVSASKIKSVLVNGQKVKFQIRPSAGRSLVCINIANAQKATVFINTEKSFAAENPVSLAFEVNESVKISGNVGKIVALNDPQGVLKKAKIKGNAITGMVKGTKGFHTLFAKIKNGNSTYWRVYRINITDTKGDALEAARYFDSVPVNANWKQIDISSQQNADVREIYKQKYLSHRPQTVSARIGTDGYSAWTYPHWRVKAPEITLANVPEMLQNNLLVTSQKVPFLWNSDKQNIAFTSLWDNFPDSLHFYVNEKGKGIWLLVSGSTNVMQCDIANAVIKLNYADGKTEKLELIPPVNYWNLSTIYSNHQAPGAGQRNDYTAEVDRFCLPAKLPQSVMLGKNCRAMLLNLKLREDVLLKSITLETLSQEVVVGLMGITILK